MKPELQRAANISYRAAGTPGAGTIVLLHGIGSTSGAWGHQYDGLGGEAFVLGWDAPGYGESTPIAAAPPTAKDYAERLKKLLDALDIDTAVIGTNSWGTPTGITFAKLYPDRVRALVLGGPARGFLFLGEEEANKRVAARIERITTLGPQEMRKQDIYRLVPKNAAPEVVAAISKSEGVNVEGYAQAARMMGSIDCAAEIKSVTCPVHVLSGDQDTTTPTDTNARPIADAAPNGRITVLPGCGHLPHLERPAEFNQALRDALK